MTVRAVVIGVGLMGSIHAEYLATRVRGAALAGVTDLDEKRALSVAQRWGVKVYESDAELLRDDEVDAVVIASPRPTHVPLIVAAAAAGKHVFSEKPLASTVAEAKAALAAVKESGRILQVGFNRRFDRNFAHAHDVIASGAIGQPLIVHIVSRDPAAAEGADRSPEDLVLETSIHDIDMASYLAGSEITEVYAIGIAGDSPGTLAGAAMTLRFANGMAGTIDNHLRSAFGYDQRAEVFGTAGQIVIDNETANRTTLSGTTGVLAPGPLYFFGERYADSYIAEMEAFAGAIESGGPSPVGGEIGRAAVQVAEAVIQSLREGRPVQVRG